MVTFPPCFRPGPLSVPALFFRGDTTIPRDDYALKPGFSLSPDWVDPDDFHLLPGLGQAGGRPDFIPDPDAPEEVVKLTPEQEKYGIGWKPGMPMRQKRTRAFLRSDGTVDLEAKLGKKAAAEARDEE